MSVLPPSSPQNTRSSLLLRLRQDGPAREVAWAEFYDLYAPIISGFARRVGASRSEVEDLVQEVLRAFFAASPALNSARKLGRVVMVRTVELLGSRAGSVGAGWPVSVRQPHLGPDRLLSPA